MEERGRWRGAARRLLRELPVFLFSAGLVACESSRPQPHWPEPIDAQSAGLGVSLCMTETLGSLRKDTIQPDLVLFVRLEDGEEVQDLTKERVLIPSTFVRAGYAYLLNASPGKYAAVAAVYGEDVEPIFVKLGSVNVGSHVTMRFGLELFGDKIVHRNYFSQAMIAKSVTTVAAGSFAFLGSFAADQSFRFGDADELQMHFMRAVEGEGVERSGLLQDISSAGRAHLLTPSGPHWQAFADTTESDRKARKAFCKEAKQCLQGTTWVPMLDNLSAAQ